jgi:hypothetical protein
MPNEIEVTHSNLLSPSCVDMSKNEENRNDLYGMLEQIEGVFKKKTN